VSELTSEQRVHFLAATLALLATVSIASDIDLAGPWDIQALPAGGWPAAMGPKTDAWETLQLPAPDWRTASAGPKHLQDADGVWLRRRFELTAAQAGQDAALVWEMIRWGFRARLNEVDLGGVELYGPGSLPVPPKTLRAGANELLLQVRGWKRVPRGSGGEVLFPIGSARFSWGDRNSRIFGGIGLDLYQGVRLRAALIDGDSRSNSVRAILRCDGALPSGATAELTVNGPDGQVLGKATAPAADPLVAACPGLPAWSPETPTLCRATVVLRAADGRELDRRDEMFGARVLSVDGTLRMDGRARPLRGSNLVHEWLRLDGEALRRFLVDDARAMNVGGFRTHTLPPSHAAAAICDQSGQWLLAEMPATYNGSPTGLDESGERTWRANAEALMAAWCEALHNHPSILAWVPVNEAPMDAPFDLQGWIHGRLIPAVRAASPGRPVLTASGNTDEIHDDHNYAGFWDGYEGQFREVALQHAASRRPGQILANTEYIEGLNPDRIFRWTGTDSKNEATQLRYAAIGAAQTETLRELGYTLILPYWFANWDRREKPWRPEAPTPMFAALRSALAPVALAWEPLNRNWRAGSVLHATVVVCNDTAEVVTRTVEIYLSEHDPMWLPGELKGEPLFRQDVTVAPGSHLRVPVTLTLPDADAMRTLVARLGDTLSQRPVRILRAGPTPSMRVRLVGGSPAALAGLRRLGLHVEAGLGSSSSGVDADVVLVWEDAEIDAATSASSARINTWLHHGGRLFMMRQRVWPPTNNPCGFPLLADGTCLSFTNEDDEASTVWRAGDGPLWQGLAPAHLDGWNGEAGVLMRETIVAPWTPDSVPVTQHSNGWTLVTDRAVVVEGRGHAAWPADYADERFLVAGQPRHFSQVRNNPLLLCTRAAPPSGGYTVRLPFTSPVMAARVQAFEHGRMGSSPFRWRIDGGSWREAPCDLPCRRMVRVSQEAAVWFGWSDLGGAELAAGKHEIEIVVDRPMADGTYLLALDALLLTPRVDSRVLAWSGGHRPAIIEVSCGAGKVLFSQLLFSGRLDPQSADCDPAAARLFGNLIATELDGGIKQGINR